MVSLYSGTPGSGKSLHIAERIYRRMQQRRPVIANFQIRKKGIKSGSGAVKGKERNLILFIALIMKLILSF